MDGSALRPIDEGLWIATTPVRFLGMQLTANMTVVRLRDGSLLLHSPVAMTAPLRAEVERLGPVAHLYSPNTFHHLRIGDWAAAFPSARIHAPPGLRPKRPDLRIDRIHGEAAGPAFLDAVEERNVGGFRLEETVLFHPTTRSLIVADLVHNIGRPTHRWTKLYTRAMGFYDQVAISRMIRATAFPDRAAARRSLTAILDLPFDRLIVGHGDPVEHRGREALAKAYAWVLSAGRGS